MPSLRMFIPATAGDVQLAAVRMHLCLLPLLVFAWLLLPAPSAGDVSVPMASWLALLALLGLPSLLHIMGMALRPMASVLAGFALLVSVLVAGGSWPMHAGEAAGGTLVLASVLVFPVAYAVSSATHFVCSGGIGRSFSALLQRLRHPFGGGGSAAPSR